MCNTSKKMTKYFFAAVNHLILSNSKNEDIEIQPGLRLTNDLEIINLIVKDEFRECIGILEFNQLKNCNALLYYKFEEEDLKVFEVDNNMFILELQLKWIDDFFKNSWILSDNCAVIDTAYMMTVEGNKLTAANSLRLAYIHSTCENEFVDLILNKESLEKFIENHLTIETYLHEKSSSSNSFMMQKNYSRIGRSLIFVKQAREAKNIAYKIANYCSAFETIFSTDNSELTYKLSERVAFFLKNDLNMNETFKSMKNAYGIRSKLTHGDVLTNKQIDNIFDISKETDSILRISLNKILENDELRNIFDSNNENVEKYFEKLIFN